jgi:hypothetical protein
VGRKEEEIVRSSKEKKNKVTEKRIKEIQSRKVK